MVHRFIVIVIYFICIFEFNFDLNTTVHMINMLSLPIKILTKYLNNIFIIEQIV